MALIESKHEATTDTWLTPAEVHQLTARKIWSAQCRALAAMGIPFRPNYVGRPLVERAAVLSQTSKPKLRREPNWGAIKHGKAA